MQTRDAEGLAGRIVDGRYRLVELIGRGGASEVYLAHDESLPRDVAVKLMLPDAAEAENLERERTEIDTLAALNHQGLVTLIDAGVEQTERGERAFLVMEHVDGPTLRELIERGSLAPDAVGHIGADIAEVLHYVHGRGLVHRDIKPGNILLAHCELPGREFTAKLADFGIARLIDGTRLTATGTIMGTASYLSPEQAQGGPIGPATDIYSLGLVLLEAFTGERAFPGPAAESVAARLHRPPAVPDALEEPWRVLLRSMTSLAPGERPDALDIALRLRMLAAPDSAYPGSAGDDAHDGRAGGLDDEPATQRLPVTASTEPFSHTAPATQDVPPDDIPKAEVRPEAGTAGHPDAPPRESVDRPGGRPRGRRRLGILVAVLVVAALAAGGVVWGVSLSGQQRSGSTSTVSYPPVPGRLGEHLKQLQESVTP